MKFSLFLSVFLGVGISLHSAVIDIPIHYPTIQQGIDAAVDGDTVIVHPGEYVENIILSHKNLTIKSRYRGYPSDRHWIEQTIIRARYYGSVVLLGPGVDSTTTLMGFTITDALPPPYGPKTFGGGIYCARYTSPVLRGLILAENMAHYGGGIYCDTHSHPLIDNVRFRNNIAEKGGGLFIDYGAHPTLTQVSLFHNHATVAGGGIYCYSQSRPLVRHSTLAHNSSDFHGGGIFVYATSPLFHNITLYKNRALSGGGLYCGMASTVPIVNSIFWQNEPEEIVCSRLLGGQSMILISHSDIQGGLSEVMNFGDEIHWLNGNLDVEPQFLNQREYDFQIIKKSDCLDAGTSFLAWEGDTLLDMNSDSYIGPAPDMGAFEVFYTTGLNSSLDVQNFTLQPNAPNPFNRQTRFSFYLPHSVHTTLSIYDASGRFVYTLVDAFRSSGWHRVSWDADAVASGVYLAVLRAGEYTQFRKCICLK